MTNRRKFNAEFRAEAVELVISSGWPLAQVAPRLVSSRGRWVTGCASGKKNTPRLVLPSRARSNGPNTRPCRQRMLS